MGKVMITADQQGNIIGVTRNPEYGYVRVEQVARVINDQGWLKNAKRSALIKGKIEDLLLCEFVAGQELSGKIVVKESLEPFNLSDPDRDLKIAGDTGVVCRFNDQPIYRQTFYTPNENACDEFITHNNGNEIKDVQRINKTLTNLSVQGANLEG